MNFSADITAAPPPRAPSLGKATTVPARAPKSLVPVPAALTLDRNGRIILAARHAAAQRIVAEQKALIGRLKATRCDAGEAERLLRRFEISLFILELQLYRLRQDVS
jgi:hypothetical protein